MLDLNLNKPDEIVKIICNRLRTERLAKNMTQADLAGRAGISTNTVSNLETGRNISFESIVRVAIVLGRIDELKTLFQPKIDSIADIQNYEKIARRQRSTKKNPNYD